MTALEAAKEPLKLYLDESAEPFKIALPPLCFRFSTLHLADGPHELRIEASNGLAPATVRSVPFQVRNGVALSITGIQADQTIDGQVELIINAYAGNTEVDFEPLCAETPQPIPTWTWVLLLVVGAWTLFYLMRPPHAPSRADYAPDVGARLRGARLYGDTCARCHGESGGGVRAAGHEHLVVPALRNSTNFSVAKSPAALLTKVVVGVSPHMAAWGLLFTDRELVAVVNHVRGAWGHDASRIEMRHRYPPPGIDALESKLLDAVRAKDAAALAAAAWSTESRPILFRRGDDGGGTIGREAVTRRWADYFEAQCDGAVTALQLREVRYDYTAASIGQENAVVIAMGRVYQTARTDGGASATQRGRFVRIYRRKRGQWQLSFDFADIPFRVGCGPEPKRAAKPRRTVVPVDLGNPLGYAEVQALLNGLDKDARTAPHANFWRMPYMDFVNLAFDYELAQGDATVRMVVPYSSDKSNLIRALRPGQTMICCMNGAILEVDVRQMPVGARPLTDKQIAQIAAWVDAGCPEVGGRPSTLERRTPEELLCGEVLLTPGGPTDVPKDK